MPKPPIMLVHVLLLFSGVAAEWLWQAHTGSTPALPGARCLQRAYAEDCDGVLTAVDPCSCERASRQHEGRSCGNALVIK
jgi:hypothetical protein